MTSGRTGSLITGPLPRYRKLYDGDRWQPGPSDEWDPNIPYGGKVYLARKKKPQGWLMTIFEVCNKNLHYNPPTSTTYLLHVTTRLV